MAINNTVELIGNIGAEARFYEREENNFAACSLATTDSYKDKDGNWQEKETVWHNVLAFNPSLISILKGLNTKARIKVTGTLSYRPFETVDGNGEVIIKREATIIARKIEQAPLAKKNKEA